jgi:hypothetical protein
LKKLANFFDIKILKKKKKKEKKTKKKWALIMMTLISTHELKLGNPSKRNGPISLKGKLIDKLVL